MEKMTHCKRLSYSFINLFENDLEGKKLNSKLSEYNIHLKRNNDDINKSSKKSSHTIYEKIIKLNKKVDNKNNFISNFRTVTPKLIPKGIYHKKVINNSLNININKSMIENNNNLLSANITNNIFILDLKQENKKKKSLNMSQRGFNNVKDNNVHPYKIDESININNEKIKENKNKNKHFKNYCYFNYQRNKSKTNIFEINQKNDLNFSLIDLDKNKKQRDLNIIPIKSKYL
jgi:hypothetical protein